MATFLDFYREIGGTIPRSNDFLAQRWVNRARADIYQARFWSFLRSFGYLQVPDQVGTGTFTVTLNSPTVTADSAATTALTGLGNPIITSRQIRFAGGPLYNIAGFSGSTLTLDRNYGATTTVGISYQVYRCYYGPPLKPSASPETDFIRYLSVLDPVQPQKLKLNKTREWLDLVDQQRTNLGTPSTHLVSFVADTSTSALPTYEMWPHPTVNRYLLCTYIRRGIDFVNDTDTLPAAIPDNLLITRALWHGYNWAMTNMGKYPELRLAATVWPTLRKETLTEYAAELARTQKLDDDTMRQAIEGTANFPTWFQSFARQMNFQGGTPVPPNAG